MNDDVKYLTLESILAGGRHVLGHPPDVRELGLLDAAVNRPKASAFGTDAYPTLAEKAAAILHSIVTSHPFIDGNKRIGLTSAIAFLELNGARPAYTEDEAYDLVLDIATGVQRDVAKIAERLAAFLR